MGISNKKAKQKAKNRRREFSNRIKMEKEHSKTNKAEKAERNRRFSGQQPQLRLPEDNYLYFDISLLIDDSKDNRASLEIFETLYERQFFYHLEKKIDKGECDNSFTLSRSLLQGGMGYGKQKVEEILNLFEEHGGHCDCEVIHNILGTCLKEDFSHQMYDDF